MTVEETDVEVKPSDGVLRSWPPRAGTAPLTFASGMISIFVIELLEQSKMCI